MAALMPADQTGVNVEDGPLFSESTDLVWIAVSENRATIAKRQWQLDIIDGKVPLVDLLGIERR